MGNDNLISADQSQLIQKTILESHQMAQNNEWDESRGYAYIDLEWPGAAVEVSFGGSEKSVDHAFIHISAPSLSNSEFDALAKEVKSIIQETGVGSARTETNEPTTRAYKIAF